MSSPLSVRTSQLSGMNVGIMFLNEVAMGDYHLIHRDGEIGWQQSPAPNKKHSCWAIGNTEPGMWSCTLINYDSYKLS